ncbi:MAG: dCTP deaminase [Elusimicrobiota bacterium]
MTIQSDKWIKMMAQEYKIIEPFSEEQVSQGTISFGPSSYGYDIRLADEFKLLKSSRPETIVDPKNLDPELFSFARGDYFILPGHSLCLTRSLEYLRIPRNVLALCTGKSTYARCGILINITPLESEWEGFITMAVSNISPLPVKIYAGEGIAQVLFLAGDQPCGISYADRKGKYQASKGITEAKVSS